MYYSLIRIVAYVFILILLLITLKKINCIAKKFVLSISLILYFVFCLVTYIIPVENLLITFKSPEDVFNYTNKGTINDIIYGKDSCIIIYSENNDSYSFDVIPKHSNGYKIPYLWTEKLIAAKMEGSTSFYLYVVSNTNDYYVLGNCITKEDDLKISDNIDSQISLINIYENNPVDAKNYLIYTYLRGPLKEYYLTIEEEKIILIK